MPTLQANDRIRVDIPSGSRKIKIICHVGGLSLTVQVPRSQEQIYEVPAGSQADITVVPGMSVSFISIHATAAYSITFDYVLVA